MFKRPVFAWVCLFLPLVAFAFCDPCNPKDKIYVQLDDLIFDENGIWLKNGSHSVAIGAEAVHVDSMGYYITKNEQTWKCPKCGFVNPNSYPGWGCKNCDFPYDN